MLELLFPTELRRLSYLTRILPLHTFLFAAFVNLGSADEFTPSETLLGFTTIAAVLYAVAFVYLPRARDAGLPGWTLLFGLLPILSNALGILLLFRRSRHARLGPRDIESPRRSGTIAGSDCSVCGKRLIVQTDGLFNPADEVVCNQCNAVRFPITLKAEDGEITEYGSVSELKTNLEDFNSDRNPGCKLRDASGRKVRLKMSLMRIDILTLEDT